MLNQKLKLLIVGVLAGSFVTFWVATFFDHYTVMGQSPVEFHKPVWIEKRTEPVEAKASEVEAVEPIVNKENSIVNPIVNTAKKIDNIDEIVRKIRILESSGGKNDGCLAKGKINGYGYGQSTHVWNCFDTHEIVRSKVYAWVKDKLDAGWSMGKALCYYQSGYKVEDCAYYQKYLKLS